MTNLYCDNNLHVLNNIISSNSIDLIYLDPPFNSNAKYFLSSSIIKEKQAAAFNDSWQWTAESTQNLEQLRFKHNELAELLDLILRQFGHNDLSAYLVMMASRLVELHRVLKSTGSLYLHCDPTASHYLKIILDIIFYPYGGQFQNEIAWCYQTGGVSKKRYARKHDSILFYTKSDEFTFNADSIKEPRTEKSLKRAQTPTGARISSDDTTKLPTDVFQIPSLNPMSKERLGYPTQKPVELLERIIKASSNPGDIVLDPFCGCGTTIYTAQRLGRQWIGIDISHLAIGLTEKRLKEAFPHMPFTIEGTPETLGKWECYF